MSEKLEKKSEEDSNPRPSYVLYFNPRAKNSECDFNEKW